MPSRSRQPFQTPAPAAPRSAARAARSAAAAPVARQLQRAAGNRAVQRLLSSALEAAEAGTRGEGQPLPHAEAIQRAFGRHDVSRIRAFTGPAAAEAASGLGAGAFAYGDKVAFSAAPSLRTAAHEAAHVVQQRGGVQLEGGVGRRGDPFERHADEVAGAVAQGRSAEPLLDRVAPGAGAAPGTAAVQGDIGVEIELPVPIVTEEDENIEGEVTLGRSAGVKIVTDHNESLTGKRHNHQIACVEAVVEHVNEAAPGGERELEGRLAAVASLVGDLNRAIANRAEVAWSAFWGGPPEGYKLTGDVQGGRVGQDVGYVQFTVGVAPAVVRDFLTDSMESLGAPTRLTGKKPGPPPNAAAAIREEALFYADTAKAEPGLAKLPPRAQRDVEGYLILCYMLAAGYYHGKRDLTLSEAGVIPEVKGVMKNYARLLPRMSPGQMFETLDRAAQEYVVGQGKGLSGLLRDVLLQFRAAKEAPLDKAIKKQVKGKFQDPAGLLETKDLRRLIENVGNPKLMVDITDLYGRMAVAERPDAVAPGMGGVPVEIRHHDALSLGKRNWMTREEWELTALTWYRHTLRSLHGAEAARREQEQ